MALFGKSSTANTNKTLYGKEKYNIVGKRVLNEPKYITQAINDIAYISCPNMSPDELVIHDRMTHFDNTELTGFNREVVLPGAVFNDRNDVIVLYFTFDGSTMKDHGGRQQPGMMAVCIDASDYANLDIKEFVRRVDADFKSHPYGDLLFSYPIIWNAKQIQKELDDPRYQTIPSKNFYGEENLRNIPQTIPYDKAIRTKDGRPVIGSVLTNPTLKDLKAPKQTKTAATPTQPAPAKKATTSTIPTPSSLNMVYDPTTNTWVKKDAIKAQPQPTPTPAKTQQPATEKVAKSKNDVVIRALTNELTGIRQQIKDLQDEAEALESQIKKLQGENSDSSTLGRK